MRRRRRGRSTGRLLLLLLVAAALVGAGYLLARRAEMLAVRAPAKPAKSVAVPRAAERGSGRRAEKPPPEPESRPRVAGRIAIVIDDLGRSVADVERLLALGVPLDYAVLPWEKRTAEVVARLGAAGVEILCHLPMESSGGANPGPNAILDSFPPRRIAALTEKAIDAVPGAIGLNNHMGSLVTSDPAVIGPVLDVVAERGLWFFDSRTSADTVAFDLARTRAIPAAKRDVFLDEDPNPAAVEAEFDRLLSIASERGAAIAIGHPHEVTLAMLERRIPEAKAAGYEIVPLSFLVERGESLP